MSSPYRARARLPDEFFDCMFELQEVHARYRAESMERTFMTWAMREDLVNTLQLRVVSLSDCRK